MVPERDLCARKTVSEAKKIKNGNRLQTGRHVSPTDILFHRQVTNPKVGTSKDTLISLKQR